MKDQPKPATGTTTESVGIGSNREKPASGEWFTTAGIDGDCAIGDNKKQLIGVGCTVQQTLNIVAAHNAALAAAWDKWQCAEKAFEAQRQQLAAEREKLIQHGHEGDEF